jgi:eukaryotic-like serine/threonine-protein kinase
MNEPSVDATFWTSAARAFHAGIEAPVELRHAAITAALREAGSHRDETVLLATVHALLDAHDRLGDRFESPLALGQSTAPPPPRAGTRIGPYLLEDEIGRGGMGVVYAATRVSDDMRKRVAIKLISDPEYSAGVTRRFERERRILATLEHPYIAALLDGGTVHDGTSCDGAPGDGTPWFAMELVDGQPIDKWCASTNADLQTRVRLLRQAAAAVAYAHQRLVVHRDLKPRNMLVTPDGQVKLLDFGIAKVLGGALGDDTGTGRLTATIAYASPEQLRGQPVSTASDVHALGLVLFELVTGERARSMDDALPMLLEKAEREPPAASEVVNEHAARRAGLPAAGVLRRQLADDLDTIIAKALHPDARMRYSSVERFDEDLARWLAGRPILARPATLGYRLRRFSLRHRRALLAGSGMLVLVVAALASSAWQARRADRERARSEAHLTEVRRLVQTLIEGIGGSVSDLPGGTAARASAVRAALASLDRVARDAVNDVEVRTELVRAYQRAGDVLGNPTNANLGDLPGADSAYTRAAELAEPLRQHDDRETRWLLANLDQARADVAAPRGHIDDAARWQAAAVSTFTDLAQTAPDALGPALAAAIASLKLGDLLGSPVFVNRGDMGGAEQAYDEALARLDRPPLQSDTRFETQRIRAVLHERRGTLAVAQGNAALAASQYASSLRVREQLAASRPLSVEARRDVAITEYLLCGVHLNAERLRDAEQACGRSLKLRAQLLREDPANAQLIRGMGIMHQRLAALAIRQGDRAAAMRHADQSLLHYARFFDDREGAINVRRDELDLLLDRAEWSQKPADRKRARDAAARLAARRGLTESQQARLSRMKG